MAHRSNVIQVKEALGSKTAQQEQVVDPVCHKSISRHDARHMLFRGETTYYFCSRECRSKFKPSKAA